MSRYICCLFIFIAFGKTNAQQGNSNYNVIKSNCEVEAQAQHDRGASYKKCIARSNIVVTEMEFDKSKHQESESQFRIAKQQADYSPAEHKLTKPLLLENRQRISIEDAKKKCVEIGFKNATEALGKCVLQLTK